MLLMSLTAFAGYGDVTPWGLSNWAEREVHIWTNAVRVDPWAFESEYPCDIEAFTETEQASHPPLYYDINLNDAGRFHSQDMHDSGVFSHDSSDGTSFPDRLARFYDESGWIGENIAAGYTSAYAAVVYGWMCSSGHRANIMTPDYNELGTGVVENYYTQDFAGDGVIETLSPIAMGTHTPEVPTADVTFLADWYGEPPTSLMVMIDGEPSPMALTYGENSMGVYSFKDIIADSECHEYWFRWRRGEEEGGFPEEGSFLFGAGCNEPLGWVEGHLDNDAEESDLPDIGTGGEDDGADFDQDLVKDEQDWSGDGDIDVVGCGCAASPTRVPGLIVLALGGLMGWRRRS